MAALHRSDCAVRPPDRHGLRTHVRCFHRRPRPVWHLHGRHMGPRGCDVTRKHASGCPWTFLWHTTARVLTWLPDSSRHQSASGPKYYTWVQARLHSRRWSYWSCGYHDFVGPGIEPIPGKRSWTLSNRLACLFFRHRYEARRSPVLAHVLIL